MSKYLYTLDKLIKQINNTNHRYFCSINSAFNNICTLKASCHNCVFHLNTVKDINNISNLIANKNV